MATKNAPMSHAQGDCHDTPRRRFARRCEYRCRLKYAIVSHAHIDHIGGAKFLQDTYGTSIAMAAADWDFTEKSTRLPTTIKPSSNGCFVARIAVSWRIGTQWREKS